MCSIQCSFISLLFFHHLYMQNHDVISFHLVILFLFLFFPSLFISGHAYLYDFKTIRSFSFPSVHSSVHQPIHPSNRPSIGKAHVKKIRGMVSQQSAVILSCYLLSDVRSNQPVGVLKALFSYFSGLSYLGILFHLSL